MDRRTGGVNDGGRHHGPSIPGIGAGGNFGCKPDPGGQRGLYRCAEFLADTSFSPVDLHMMGLVSGVEVPDQWVVTDSNFGANWATLCDGRRLLTSGSTRLTINNDVIAAIWHSLAAYTSSHLPGGRRWWCPMACCRPDAMAFYNYFAQRMEARERAVHEGFSKRLSAPPFVARGRALIATVDTAVVVPTRPDRRGIFPCRANYFHDCARRRKAFCWMAVPARRVRA